MATSTTTLQSPSAQNDNVKSATNDDTEKSAIQRLSQGVTLSGIPSFTSLEVKRQWMLEHLAGAFRVFARKGYVEGLTGHISLRDPEYSNCFWTNPYGMHFGLIKVSDLILLNEDGVPVGGATHLPAGAAGFQIHSHLHKRYPHVNAACHTHSPYGKAYSAFGKRLDMINLDVVDFYGEGHGVYSEFGGVTLNEAESERLVQSLGPKGKGLILLNHGLLTVGQTVDEAAYLFSVMERSCQVQLLVDAAAAGSGHKKVPVSDEAAAYTAKAMADPETLYCAFQPEYEMEKAVSNGTFLK
ncbi:class II aldolase/adducin N-terminal [Talaromyces proteolyticus]|uniref:Class II aldolase/adducin N-terminal n=1 Tax=Talaromyces proteolyticus TaxID=1131652 RepID=A0AAD4Q1R6_9EURO|nr:class II aldolase/adducin N-terminal [Talaromyces proteolyticus]KAH8702514.1 class II aldolase/adducin N-terminal [Talaromyces proteolyticus]